MVSDDTVACKTPSSPNSGTTDIPPSVMAISNLRCPSPPPILNRNTNRSYTTSPPLQVSPPPLVAPNPKRETIPAGGALLKEKEKDVTHTPEYPSIHVDDTLSPVTSPAFIHLLSSPNNGSASSLDYTLNPPANSIHHKVPSVHAHFYVDEAVKSGKRSRSGSTNGSVPEHLPATLPGATSFVASKSASEVTNINSSTSARCETPTNGEQNANIDPRLPQDDGKFHILLGVCGALSTGKIKLVMSKLFEIYTPQKLSVQLILTQSSEKFISPEVLQHLETVKKIRVWRDSDEWTTWKTRLDPVLHIELRRWADILIVCPLTANTLSKISLGLCDNLLTNVIRAWNTSYPILLAPSMVSYSYNAITTKRQLRMISEEMPWIEILKPVEKVVGSFGDIGMGGMMDWNEIVNKIVLKLGGYPEDDEDDKDEKDDNEEAVLDDNDDDDDDDDDDEEDEVDEINNSSADIVIQSNQPTEEITPQISKLSINQDL